MLLRVFEKFAQADCSLERGQGGLGLGLALVKVLVELHGGEVRGTSEGLGHGTKFTISLPLEPEQAAPVEATATESCGGGRCRILVVEDNRDAADSLRLLLELFGYEVAVAYSGPEAVEVARQFRPDVVLSDLGLPGMDGYAVATALRQHPATAAAQLIAVSGYAGEEDQRRCREAGFNQHLTKPVDPEKLRRLLPDLLAGV